MKRLILPLLMLTLSCSQETIDDPKTSWQTIAGRDQALEHQVIRRYPVYRARIPANWQRKDPSPTDSIQDTTKSLVEFIIPSENPLTISIHNFPTDKIEERIPPQAQVARWKRQIGADEVVVLPEAYGGFSGYYFEGKGNLKGSNVGVLGWTMQLSPEHYHHLQSHEKKEKEYLKQMRADYTIKVVGLQDQIMQHRSEIIAFAHSFELIQEIPSP